MTASGNKWRSGRTGRIGLAAAATLALAASSAFVSTPQPRAGGVITTERFHVQPALAMPATGEYRRAGQSTSTATWQVVGAAVLLLASAAVPRRASKTSSLRRCQVVSCRAMPVPAAMSVVAPTPPSQLIPAEPVLLDLTATEETLPQQVFSVATAKVPSVMPAVPVQAVPKVAPEEQSQAAGAPRRSSARFVGGARRSASRAFSAKGRSSRATRAARRSMGARLQPACVAEPIICSFDISKARAPIQHGLKATSRARGGKDTKSATYNRETSDVGVGISARYFDMNQHHHRQNCSR
mmetsp:Transcript_57620/g.148234  ORF Transcript_57620/g.148234 Transcript_57620/m.148234 type:complete len:297 (-) Transcript_57620:304-1194(-)